MTKLLRRLTFLLFISGVLAALPATAQSCDYLVTCYAYLPEHQVAESLWVYSHQCCDLEDHTTIWDVYIDFRNRWHLVSTSIPP